MFDCTLVVKFHRYSIIGGSVVEAEVVLTLVVCFAEAVVLSGTLLVLIVNASVVCFTAIVCVCVTGVVECETTEVLLAACCRLDVFVVVCADDVGC